MQLELLNEQGQAASTFDAPETVFGRARTILSQTIEAVT